ncbi:basic proline-rich protein [Cebus imitator]|uniref:basic proline-rich protein n=1 Tax=Cebus imitator TaxID=2715852 RepID=UPI00189B63AA|nr:basic proline-rich protein [Cebus imitator]
MSACPSLRHRARGHRGPSPTPPRARTHGSPSAPSPGLSRARSVDPGTPARGHQARKARPAAAGGAGGPASAGELPPLRPPLCFPHPSSSFQPRPRLPVGRSGRPPARASRERRRHETSGAKSPRAALPDPRPPPGAPPPGGPAGSPGTATWLTHKAPGPAVRPGRARRGAGRGCRVSPPAHTSAEGRGSEPLRCGDLPGPRAEQEVSQGREPEGSGLSFPRRPAGSGGERPARPPTGTRGGGASICPRAERGFPDERETRCGRAGRGAGRRRRPRLSKSARQGARGGCGGLRWTSAAAGGLSAGRREGAGGCEASPPASHAPGAAVTKTDAAVWSETTRAGAGGRAGAGARGAARAVPGAAALFVKVLRASTVTSASNLQDSGLLALPISGLSRRTQPLKKRPQETRTLKPVISVWK